MKKFAIVAILAALAVSACTFSDNDQVINDLDRKGSVTIALANISQTKSSIIVSENPVVSAHFVVSGADGYSQSATWNGSIPWQHDFTGCAEGTYTLFVTETDSAGNTSTNSASLTVRAGYNTVVSVTLGGTISVVIPTPTVEPTPSPTPDPVTNRYTRTSGYLTFNYTNITGEITREGLVAEYLLFDSPSDTSIYNNQGINYGASNFATDHFGTLSAFYFQDGAYISFPDAPQLTTSESFTASFWVKSENTPGVTMRILGRYDNDLTGGWAVYQNADGQPTVQLSTEFGEESFPAVTALSNNGYNHLAVRYDRATSTLNIIVDGYATSYSPVHPVLTYVPREWQECANLELGRYWAWGTSTFTGSLDDFRLYNRALSNDELMNVISEYPTIYIY